MAQYFNPVIYKIAPSGFEGATLFTAVSIIAR